MNAPPALRVADGQGLPFAADVVSSLGLDPLSDFLLRLHFPSWRSGLAVLNAPWRVEAGAAAVSFYLVVAGGCEIKVHGETPLSLCRGDAAITAGRSRHQLSDGTAFGDSVEQGDAETTRILYGSFAAATGDGHPLKSLLPLVVALPAGEQTGVRCCDGLIDWLAAEAESARPGSAAVVSRFLQSLLVESLRTCLAAATTLESRRFAQPAGPLQAGLDPCLGPVLRLVHAAPERDWTVHSMARESGLSRSAFADRFRTQVGQPPLQYVTEIRMQKAVELLETTDIPVKRIAALIGYESVSAFSSAFKRRFGGPPVSVRTRAVQ